MKKDGTVQNSVFQRNVSMIQKRRVSTLVPTLSTLSSARDSSEVIAEASEALVSLKRWNRLAELTCYLAFFEDVVFIGYNLHYLSRKEFNWGPNFGLNYPDMLVCVSLLTNFVMFGHRTGAFDWMIILKEKRASIMNIINSPPPDLHVRKDGPSSGITPKLKKKNL